MAFLVVLPIAMLFAAYKNKRIEETIALSMIWASLLTYICGIVYELWIAPYIVAGVAVISFTAALVLIAKKKSFSNILTLGLLEYLALSGYYLLVMKGRRIIGQDGLRVYERFATDYYNVGDINRYNNPIGLMMWKYLNLKFWPNYSEGIQLLGPVTMCIALMLFIFSFKEENFKNTLKKALIGFFFIVILPLNFRGNLGYFTMQFDFVSGMLTAYIVCACKKLIDTKDDFYKTVILSGLIYLVHIKTTGIVLAGICVLIMTGMDMILGQEEGLKRYTFSIICGVSLLISKLSWTVFCRLNGKSEKFDVGVALQKLPVVALLAVILALALAAYVIFLLLVKRKFKLYVAALMLMAAAVFGGSLLIIPGEIRVSTVVNFAKMVLSNYAVDREYGLGSQFLMPYIIPMICLPLFGYMLALGLKDDAKKTENRTLVILLNAGFVLYAAVTFLTNYYGRSLTQTAKAKECERYLFVYIIVYLLIYLFLFMKDYDASIIYRPLMLVLLTVGFFMTSKSFLVTQLTERPEVETFDGVDYVLPLTKEDKFYFVDQRKEQTAERFYLKTSPAAMVKWDYTDLYLSEDGRDEQLSHEEWVEQLMSCTYVYVATVGEDFAKTYGDVFEDEIIEGHIYTVTVVGDSVSLRSIEY